MLQIHSQLTQQEFIRFNYRHFFSRPITWVLLGIFGLVFISSLFSVILFSIVEYEGAGLLEQSLPLLIISAIFALICWSVYYQSKCNYASTKSVHDPITYTFSDTGIHLKGRSFESDLKWELVQKVGETKSMFLVYQNNLAANLPL